MPFYCLYFFLACSRKCALYCEFCVWFYMYLRDVYFYKIDERVIQSDEQNKCIIYVCLSLEALVYHVCVLLFQLHLHICTCICFDVTNVFLNVKISEPSCICIHGSTCCCCWETNNCWYRYLHYYFLIMTLYTIYIALLYSHAFVWESLCESYYVFYSCIFHFHSL